MPAADPLIFDDMMPHTITVYPSTGKDSYGKLTHATTGVKYRCYNDDSYRITRTQEGEAVAVSRTSYINTLGERIGTNDKIVFADGSTRPIVGISHHHDQDGAVHSVSVQFS